MNTTTAKFQATFTSAEYISEINSENANTESDMDRDEVKTLAEFSEGYVIDSFRWDDSDELAARYEVVKELEIWDDEAGYVWRNVTVTHRVILDAEDAA